jgi:organic hydroperoxide reductase OsmC/OhrA
MHDSGQFRVVAWWSSDRNGIAKSASAPNAIHFTSPPAFGGVDGRWTPEDLLLASIASSYTTTFRMLAEHSEFEHTDLQVEVEGIISNSQTGYSFAEVRIHASLMIPHEEDQARALKLLHSARRMCGVSHALVVPQIFEPLVTVSVPV